MGLVAVETDVECNECTQRTVGLQRIHVSIRRLNGNNGQSARVVVGVGIGVVGEDGIGIGAVVLRCRGQVHTSHVHGNSGCGFGDVVADVKRITSAGVIDPV